MSNNDPGLVISEPGEEARDPQTRKKIFDSRDYTYRFVDRKHYKNGVVADATIGERIKHGLGYPPLVSAWLYFTYQNYPGDPDIDQASLMTEFEGVSCDDVYIYIVPDPTNIYQFNAVPTHILIGTDNLESPADKTVYIS